MMLRHASRATSTKNGEMEQEYQYEDKAAGLNVPKKWSSSKLRGIKGPWSPEEDARLAHLVNELGPEKWVLIASRLGSRTGKQCRERWHNHLDPHINKTPFTAEEDDMIFRLYAQMGSKWAEMSKLMPGRPDNAIKNHFNTSLQRKKRKMSAPAGLGISQASSTLQQPRSLSGGSVYETSSVARSSATLQVPPHMNRSRSFDSSWPKSHYSTNIPSHLISTPSAVYRPGKVSPDLRYQPYMQTATPPSAMRPPPPPYEAYMTPDRHGREGRGRPELPALHCSGLNVVITPPVTPDGPPVGPPPPLTSIPIEGRRQSLPGLSALIQGIERISTSTTASPSAPPPYHLVDAEMQRSISTPGQGQGLRPSPKNYRRHSANDLASLDALAGLAEQESIKINWQMQEKRAQSQSQWSDASDRSDSDEDMETDQKSIATGNIMSISSLVG